MESPLSRAVRRVSQFALVALLAGAAAWAAAVEVRRAIEGARASR